MDLNWIEVINTNPKRRNMFEEKRNRIARIFKHILLMLNRCITADRISSCERYKGNAKYPFSQVHYIVIANQAKQGCRDDQSISLLLSVEI